MNLFGDTPDGLNTAKEFLSKQAGFSDKQIEVLHENYRPLGACSAYIWEDFRNALDTEGDIWTDWCREEAELVKAFLD